MDTAFFMTPLDESLQYLYNLQFFGIKLGLENIRRLCAFAGDPQKRYISIHVAGTNGKGSVCAAIHAILRRQGFRVGLYTSPHIHHFRERIQVDGTPISDGDLIRLTNLFRPEIDRLNCTFFEATTAMAFQYFSEAGVQAAVVETGLGGRLDATNVLEPNAVVITSIGLDHTEHLGHDIASIAREKAGIIKSGIPVIVGQMETEACDVIREAASRHGAPALFAGESIHIDNAVVTSTGSRFDLTIENRRFSDLFTPLAGRYQMWNGALAVAAAVRLSLDISETSVREGLASVHWKGRLQKIADSPAVFVDAAHNAAALSALIDTLLEWFTAERIHLVIGMLKDKDYVEAARRMGPRVGSVTTVTPNSHRAVPAEELASVFEEKANPARSVRDAIETLRLHVSPGDVIVVTGSHFVLSEVEF